MSRTFPGFALLALLLLLPAAEANETIKPGEKFPTLTIGPATYQQVQIRSVTVRTVMFTHSGGMASLRLRDLPPEWQERFNYDPAAEAAAEAAEKSIPPPAPKPVVRKPAAPKASAYDTLLASFGQPAPVQAAVSLRPRFQELGLEVRDQGRRPSCSIYAIVSALEYQSALVSGEARNYSENYLIWATCKTVQRTVAPTNAAAGEPLPENYDAGFSLSEVVLALRAYGVPLQDSMPNQRGTKMQNIAEPTDEIIREAREHQRVSLTPLPGRDNATRLNNLVFALNAGIPVPVGMAWPNPRTCRSGYLSKQQPMTDAYHAVTIVGYESPSGSLTDTVFLFKNSYGDAWGQGGYGRATYEYLVQHLYDAVTLEVQR